MATAAVAEGRAVVAAWWRGAQSEGGGGNAAAGRPTHGRTKQASVRSSVRPSIRPTDQPSTLLSLSASNHPVHDG